MAPTCHYPRGQAPVRLITADKRRLIILYSIVFIVFRLSFFPVVRCPAAEFGHRHGGHEKFHSSPPIFSGKYAKSTMLRDTDDVPDRVTFQLRWHHPDGTKSWETSHFKSGMDVFDPCGSLLKNYADTGPFCGHVGKEFVLLQFLR